MADPSRGGSQSTAGVPSASYNGRRGIKTPLIDSLKGIKSGKQVFEIKEDLVGEFQDEIVLLEMTALVEVDVGIGLLEIQFT